MEARKIYDATSPLFFLVKTPLTHPPKKRNHPTCAQITSVSQLSWNNKQKDADTLLFGIEGKKDEDEEKKDGIDDLIKKDQVGPYRDLSISSSLSIYLSIDLGVLNSLNSVSFSLPASCGTFRLLSLLSDHLFRGTVFHGKIFCAGTPRQGEEKAFDEAVGEEVRLDTAAEEKRQEEIRKRRQEEEVDDKEDVFMLFLVQTRTLFIFPSNTTLHIVHSYIFVLILVLLLFQKGGAGSTRCSSSGAGADRSGDCGGGGPGGSVQPHESRAGHA